MRSLCWRQFSIVLAKCVIDRLVMFLIQKLKLFKTFKIILVNADLIFSRPHLDADMLRLDPILLNANIWTVPSANHAAFNNTVRKQVCFFGLENNPRPIVLRNR